MDANFNFNELAADMVENLGGNELEFTKEEFILLCSICNNVKPEIDLKIYGAKIFTIGLLINKFPAFFEMLEMEGISSEDYKILTSFLWNNTSYEIHSYFSNMLTPKIKSDQVSIYSPAKNKITVLGLGYSPEIDKKICALKNVSGIKYSNNNWLVDVLENSEIDQIKDEIKIIING